MVRNANLNNILSSLVALIIFACSKMVVLIFDASLHDWRSMAGDFLTLSSLTVGMLQALL